MPQDPFLHQFVIEFAIWKKVPTSLMSDYTIIKIKVTVTDHNQLSKMGILKNHTQIYYKYMSINIFTYICFMPVCL